MQEKRVRACHFSHHLLEKGSFLDMQPVLIECLLCPGKAGSIDVRQAVEADLKEPPLQLDDRIIIKEGRCCWCGRCC